MIKLGRLLESINEVSIQAKLQKLVNFVKKYQNQLDENTQQYNDDVAVFNLNQILYNNKPLQGQIIFRGGPVTSEGNFTKYSDLNIPFDIKYFGNATLGTAREKVIASFQSLIKSIKDDVEDGDIILPNNVNQIITQISPNWQQPNVRLRGININRNLPLIDTNLALLNLIQNYDTLQGHEKQVADVINKSLSSVGKSTTMNMAKDQSCTLVFTNGFVPPLEGGIYMWKDINNNKPIYIGKAGREGEGEVGYLSGYINAYRMGDGYNFPNSRRNYIKGGGTLAPSTRVKINGKLCTRLSNNNNLYGSVATNNQLNNLVATGINQQLYNAFLNSDAKDKNTESFFEGLLIWYYGYGTNGLKYNDKLGNIDDRIASQLKLSKLGEQQVNQLPAPQIDNLPQFQQPQTKQRKQRQQRQQPINTPKGNINVPKGQNISMNVPEKFRNGNSELVIKKDWLDKNAPNQIGPEYKAGYYHVLNPSEFNLINEEISRLQKLAGILKEEEDFNVTPSKEWNMSDEEYEFLELKNLLNQAGCLIEDDSVETGTEEWMEFAELVMGEDPFEDVSDEAQEKMNRAIQILEKYGIELN